MVDSYRGLRFRYWKDDGWFVGQCLDRPGRLTQARTLTKLKVDLWSIDKLMSTLER